MGVQAAYTPKYRKCDGYYQNIKTGEIQFLWGKCKGWRQLTCYGQGRF